ncbi:valine--tRNA ligase [Bilifractor porci]|uniref:Valine--tRNA ligase n=1 Tax=Bilifractor porci TaxID=2606636 RepID=A0A7X2P7K6_9FIRM|nr:valine--tRNA ligase [Bilifractor porci]MST81705.1 valine--tRNA ligase [Bilifractor porci]
MSKELAKTYDPKGLEDRLYQKWMDHGYFHAKVNPDKKPFSIVMPPPNVTGQLHMGHALDNTMQDILIRFKRMQGYEALWQPGTDHAAIATEVKVTNMLKEKGIDKHEIGRDEFLKYCWQWKDEYGSRIMKQLRKLGSSADWERERFTMDEGCSKAVEEVFVRLYEKGWIYKGSRIINWCPKCQTSLSDAEVEHVDQDGFFWHINYPIVGEPGKYVEIATTRPETLLGDTAVAVNPEDERYRHLIGKMLKLPLTDREIPVIADEYVDKEFGTGCVKITPAHDPNDFEVGKRHGLEEINILNDDATMNDRCGKYAGMDRYEARKAMVEDLEKLGLLVKVVPHTHAVGTHDRCHTTVEPMIKPQWFVRMKEMGQAALDAYHRGELSFVPENYGKTYEHWLDNIKDWCISRQLWWGHRIPAYYCQDCGEIVVRRGGAPDTCPKCGGHHFKQDEDTLDTWFSSALWPFSTLGWPDKTPELEYFYPTDVLVTGYDIIFFWVIRMVFSGIEQTGKVPFHHVLIHGLVRDSQGRKMSKSLGNGIDPLEVIDKYGADALRLTLMTGNAPGNDMRFYWERVEASRNFANKVWNASRFILMNMEGRDVPKTVDPERLTAPDRWILDKVNQLAADVTDNMDRYELGIAVQKVYDFIWEEFCDWYIEMSKPVLYSGTEEEKLCKLAVLRQVLSDALKLLHPFMPFITEEIYCTLNPDEETIMTASWPVFREGWSFPEDAAGVELIKDAVTEIRNVRTSLQVPPGKKANVFVVSEDEGILDTFRRSESFFSFLAKADHTMLQKDKAGIGDDAISAVIPGATIYIPFAELVDVEKERARLKKEEERLQKEISRSNGMLRNEKFMSRAPKAKVEEEQAKLEKYRSMMAQVQERLAQLGA